MLNERDSRGWDLSPLAHPLWWAALGLLLVNDNLLKGGGVVPGWLTGKLSDFGFLVVAPVLAAVLLPRAVPARRALGVVAVVGLYVAADLSQTVANAVAGISGAFGLSWRLWADVTDLVALAVLPLSLRLLRGRPAARLPNAAPRHLRQRAGLLLGAFACLATSGDDGELHHPFLVNLSGAPASVRVTWVLRRVPEDITPEALAAMLKPSDLDDPREVELRMGEVATLAAALDDGASPVAQCSVPPDARVSIGSEVAVAILETPDATPVLMVARAAWSEYPEQSGACGDPGPRPVSRCRAQFAPGEAPGRDAVSLVEVDGRLSFVVDPRHAGPIDPDVPTPVRIAPVDLEAVAMRADTPAGCRAVRERYHALLASAPDCVEDADCTVLGPAPGTADREGCNVYLPTRIASEASELSEQWRSACISSEFCPGPQPPVCRDGSCQAVCPGIPVPVCPAPCSSEEHERPGAKCATPTAYCLSEAGAYCRCLDNVVDCTTPPIVSAECSLRCYPLQPQPASPQSGVAGRAP